VEHDVEQETVNSQPAVVVDKVKLSEPDLQMSCFEQLFEIVTCYGSVRAWHDHRSTA
jgi:hypothetical protein